MKKNRLAVKMAVGVLLVLAMAACNRFGPPPANATVNGVTGIDRATGTATLSVSGLDAQGSVITKGRIANASATVDQPGFNVGGHVCGDIENKGPITGALTLDASGSMSSNDPSKHRATGAKQFVTRMTPDDRVVVTAFAGNTHTRFTDLISDKEALNEAIDKAAYARGGTPLWNASYEIVQYLADDEGGNKMALIFTDGEDNSSQRTPQDVIDLAQHEQVRLYMIGLGGPGSIETTNMTNVAAETGGSYARIEEAVDLPDLFNEVFNASKAAGCISISFDPTPAAGQTMTGQLSFSINKRQFVGSYGVTF